MAVNGRTTDANGDAILISLQEPYKNVVEVVGYEDVTKGENTGTYYNKQFRWGTDGVTYSDYISLNNVNLEALLLNPNKPFWIQYRYEQVGDGTLEFESIALELVTDGGVICRIPQVECGSEGCVGVPNLVVDCCGGAWNPYDLSRASSMYNQLSAITSDMFGFCVDYFKTEADQRSRDVILKEYSLFDVIKEAEVKILVPDNELPTREIQFNPMMMDFPVQFEIHIVKSAFESVFGLGAKPEMRDYLYFKQYMNRMYEIDAIAEADDFLYAGSYWRVSLVPYQKRTAVGYENTTEGIQAEVNTEALISNVEDKFRVERENEFRDVRKDNQYNTIGTQCNDYIRRSLDKRLIIKEENVYNEWTIISKYHYELSSIANGNVSIRYQYEDGWTKEDDRAFTFWVRPKYKKPIGNNVLILSIVNNNGKVQLNTGNLPTFGNAISVGDWVNIRGTQSYNSLYKVIEIIGDSIVIDEPYIDDILVTGSPSFNKEVSNNFMIYENDLIPPTQNVSFTYTYNWFIMKINDSYYKWKISQPFIKDDWYAIVINLNATARQLSLFVYNTLKTTGAVNPDLTNTLNLIYNQTKTYSPVDVKNNDAWKILGCQTDLTNIRIWQKPIEEELQSLVLSQYVVKDTHLTLLLDNASPQLMLQDVTDAR
jgi:hypothetical protein